MADTHIHHEEDHDSTVHHETRDINVRGVLWFALIFVVVAVVLHTGLYYMLVGFRSYENSRQATPLTDVQIDPSRQLPPEPRLQPFPQPAAIAEGVTEGREQQEGAQVPGQFRNPWETTPAADWAEYRARYEKKLNSYGWVDQRNGVVRIPIDEAKDRLLAQGLPSRPALPVTTTERALDMQPLPGAPVAVSITPTESGAEEEGIPPVAATAPLVGSGAGESAPVAQTPPGGEPNR